MSDPPGAHVKGIADEDARASAQRRSEGPTPPVDDGRLRRAGTFLLGDGFRAEGEDGIPSAAMSSNVGGMGAHWTCACPRPGRQRAHRLRGRARRAARRGRAGSSASRRTPSTTRPSPTRYAAAWPPSSTAAAPRDAGSSRCRSRCPSADDGTVTWSGSDVVFGDVTRENPRSHAARRRARAPGGARGQPGRRSGCRRHDSTVPSTRSRPPRSWSRPTRCAPRSCSGPRGSGPPRSAATSTTRPRSSTPSGFATGCGLRLSQPAAGQALRHSQRLRTAVPQSQPSAGLAARGPAGSGQRAYRHVLPQSHLRRAARQVGS